MWYKNRVLQFVLVSVVVWLLWKYAMPLLERFENPDTKVNPPCPPDYTRCPSGDCIDSRDPHQTCPHQTDAY
jgi:hypothetical protein